MGFLSGLAGTISPALTVASQAEGTYQGAESQAAQQKTQAVIQSYMLARQQHQMDIENALKQAQTGEAGAHSALYQHEARKPQLGDPGYAQAMGDVAGAEAQQKGAAEWPYKEQELRSQLENNLSLERARGATEAQIAAQRIAGEKQIEGMRIQNAVQLQSNQQGFQAGQQQRQQTFQQGQTQQQIQGRIQEIGAQGNNSVITSLGRKVGLLNTPATPQQTEWDAAAQHLQAAQPGADPSAVLGPRP